KEMDFSMLIEESEIKGALGNFLKGSIDLVFSKNGKYYIADYKSDKLFSYEEQFLMTKIYENNYNLQRDFYAYVFFTYLKSLSDEKTALSQFGGVYYLFLRGMDPKKKNMGIYSDLGKGNDGAWDKERFAQIEENIKFYINRSLGQIPS
ncbi:MAG: PD-(D/E)XK nuclease family protein, partial [Nanoarchaeota archaeon]